MKSKLKKIGGSLLAVTLFAAAIYVLAREFGHYGVHDIARSLLKIAPAQLALGIGFSTICYLALTGYDALAWQHMGYTLPYRRIAKASFVGYAFSHNMGFSLLTGVPVKYRIYSSWGLKATDVAKVVAFSGLTLVVGFSTLMGLVLVFEPEIISAMVGISVAAARPIGGLLLAFVASYVALAAFRKRPIRLMRLHISIPAPHIPAGQILVSCAEWMSAAAALYMMFEPRLQIPYLAFLAIFLCAYVAGFVSQVPGGLGVFDTIILITLKPLVQVPDILAALLAYRAIFYLLPLLVALAILGVHEIFHRKNALKSKSA